MTVYFLGVDEIDTWVCEGKDRAELHHQDRRAPTGRDDRKPEPRKSRP